MAPLRNSFTQQPIKKVCSDITCERKPLITSDEDLTQHNDHQAKISDVDAFVCFAAKLDLLLLV